MGGGWWGNGVREVGPLRDGGREGVLGGSTPLAVPRTFTAYTPILGTDYS